jgi:hypothetical protein
MDIVTQLTADVEACQAPLSFGSVTIIVIVSCVLGLAWAAVNFMSVKKINVETGEDG